MDTTEPTVVTALYGSAHVPYALALLGSLHKLGHKDVLLVHADVPEAALERLSRGARLCPFERVGTTIEETTRSGRAHGKLAAWAQGLRLLPDGAPVAFLDADTFGQRPLLGAFSTRFDVAHTLREGRRWTVNSGVVFLRASPCTRRWLDEWRTTAAGILAEPLMNQAAIDHFGAAEQAALVGSLRARRDLVVERLPGAVWNEDWISEAPGDVAIWHLKGALPGLLGDKDDPRAGQPVFSTWRAAHEEMSR